MHQHTNKRFMPIAIDVADKQILLIGGGKVAYHKIPSLQQYCNNIHVIARHVSDEVKSTGVTYQEKEYEPNDLDGSYIVYACTNIKELNSRIKADAQERRILSNVVDNPEMCDFVSPAIYKRDYISVAVTSNGQRVYKSIEVRNKIKSLLDYDTALLD